MTNKIKNHKKNNHVKNKIDLSKIGFMITLPKLYGESVILDSNNESKKGDNHE